MELIKRFFSEDEGASMVEYGLLVALIAVVAMAAVGLIGTQLNSTFESVAEELGATIE